MRKKNKKSYKKGFTITELAIVLVVVAILALVSVPIYRRYVRQAIASEGRALLGEVAAAQEIYFARYGKFFAGSVGQEFSGAFGVDARRNRYFRGFHTEPTDGGGFRITTSAEDQGITLTLDGSHDSPPEITETTS